MNGTADGESQKETRRHVALQLSPAAPQGQQPHDLPGMESRGGDGDKGKGEGGNDMGLLFARRRRMLVARLASAGLTRPLLAELSGFKQCPPAAVMCLWMAVLAGTGAGE